MKSLKYLNGVLTVIAVCLTILTISVIGAFPKANASANTNHFVNSPLKKDKTQNTVPPGDDLIPFPTKTNGIIYINKKYITYINNNGIYSSDIHFTGGGDVSVNGDPLSNANKVK